MPTGFKLKGAKRLEKAFDPRRFKAVARKHLRMASRRNGVIAQARIREFIRANEGGFTKNADLTVAIKGEGKNPLVDTAQSLFQAITYVVVDDTTTFVGVPSKDSFYDVARAIHEGTSIPVSDKMRGMFYMLWRASVGDPVALEGRAKQLFAKNQDWLPLRASTTAIVIPPRPYMTKAFDDPKLRAMAHKNWQDAINAAMKEQARG